MASDNTFRTDFTSSVEARNAKKNDRSSEFSQPQTLKLKNEKFYLDSLNPGSCFCVYSAFNDEQEQIVDFYARTPCIIETVKAKDLLEL